MNKYRIENPNNNKVREYKSRTTENPNNNKVREYKSLTTESAGLQIPHDGFFLIELW